MIFKKKQSKVTTMEKQDIPNFLLLKCKQMQHFLLKCQTKILDMEKKTENKPTDESVNKRSDDHTVSLQMASSNFPGMSSGTGKFSQRNRDQQRGGLQFNPGSNSTESRQSNSFQFMFGSSSRDAAMIGSHTSHQSAESHQYGSRSSGQFRERQRTPDGEKISGSDRKTNFQQKQSGEFSQSANFNPPKSPLSFRQQYSDFLAKN